MVAIGLAVVNGLGHLESDGLTWQLGGHLGSTELGAQTNRVVVGAGALVVAVGLAHLGSLGLAWQLAGQRGSFPDPGLLHEKLVV